MSNDNESGSKDQEEDKISGFPSMADFTKEGFKTLVEAIRHSNALPTGEDWDFYSTSESFVNFTKDKGNDILHLMNSVVKYNEIQNNIKNMVVDDRIELLIEANDIILERVANNIDILNGIKKTPENNPIELQTVSAEVPINGSWNRYGKRTYTLDSHGTSTQSMPQQIKLITAKNIVRPQKFFKDKIDNRNNFPWEPRITDKPNSLKPLAIFLEEYEGRQEYSHPYEFELERFQPAAEHLKFPNEPTYPKPITETPLIEVEREEQLEELLETLRGCKEFAVDLEHHSYRSFLGITCLMQISTKEKDYIIDTLTLRDKLWILNEVFTKPTIVKIFHGADCDVEWLQRDLSLYVVNMFDTYHAAKILEYSSLSLAYLLKRFCNIMANKQYQLADWRIRPLPNELKSYARDDTHYLIYIYECLKKELYNKAMGMDNLIKNVFERSKEICKKRYFKPILTNESHLTLYIRSKRQFDNRQLYALKELYKWRDLLARIEDESVGYVLPNHMLLYISESLPREMQGILACCNPIPPLVRSNLLAIHQIILKARGQPLEKPIFKDDTRGRGTLINISKINIDSPLHCPHDLSKSNEFRDDLPILLGKNCNKYAEKHLNIEKTTSTYSVFNSFYKNVINKTVKKVTGYLSPYERYKLVRPFIVNTEKQQTEEEQQEKIDKTTENNEENQEKPTNNEEEEKQCNEERTDEERIASVREHFLKLNEQFKKDQEEKEKALIEKNKSLLEMGGSKKRKRMPSNSENDEEIIEEKNNLYTPAPPIVVNPIAIINKRRHQQENEDETPKKKRKRIRKRKWKNPMDNDNKNNVQNYENNLQNNNKTSRWAKRKQKKQQFEGAKMEEKFEPFNYGTVEYKRFQGGAAAAGTSNRSQQFKSKFKNKGKKRMWNKGVKSETFKTSMGK